MTLPTILEMKRQAMSRAQQYLSEGEDSALILYDQLSREFHPAVTRTVLWDLINEGKVTFS